VRGRWLLSAVGCLALLGCQETVTASPSPTPEVSPRGAPTTATSPAPAPLLRAAPGGDGDSWRDTRGTEYRLGLVNTPELSECFGNEASSKRKQLVAAGFRATSYSIDTHRRHVAVVYLADGRNLNVWLARNGYANDRYLKTFRNENRALAAVLEPAFAAARRERRGLWGACGVGQG
jgi:endonuclease YncB( thermonuclease family)